MKKKIIVVIFLVLGFLGFVLFLISAVNDRQISTLVLLCYLILPAYVLVIIGLFYNKLILEGLSLAFSLSAISNTIIVQVEPNLNLFTFCLFLPCFLFLTIEAAIYLRRHRKNNNWRAGVPLGILLSCALIVASIASLLKPLDIYFLWRLEGYNEVINRIQNDKIELGNYGWAYLPEEYKYLSDNGLIQAQKNSGVWSILFYKTTSILEDESGYMYRSDNAPPSSMDWCENWHRLKYPNWIYCGVYSENEVL